MRFPSVHRRSRALLGSLLALAALAAFACTTNETAPATPTSEGTAPASPTATAVPEPQVLTIRMTGEPSTLDPQQASDIASTSIVRNLFSALLRIDKQQQLQPDLAREVPTAENGGVSADGLTYTFRLRDGLKWSDGSDLVAQDFVNAVERLFAPGAANYFADFYRMIAADGAQEALEEAQANDVEGDELVTLEQAVVDNLEVFAPDDQTVVYQLNAPSPVFTVLASLWPLAPVKQDVVDAHGDAWTEPGNMVSNGPFRLAEWDHTVSLTLERNEHWHGDGPLLDEVRFDIVGDDALAFLAYRGDELDVVAIGPDQLVQVRGTDLEDEFVSYAQLSTVGVFFNFNTAELQDLKVREALAGSFDRDEFAEIVSEGSVLPAYSYLPPGMAGHDPDAGLQFQDAVARSQQLLAEAGYPGGEGLTVTLLGANVGGSATRAEWLKEQWEKNLGIAVVLDLIEPSSFVEKLFAGDWDLISGSWTADYPDPQDWLPAFSPGGALSVGGFEDDRFTALLDEAASELDADRRIELYLEAQRILIDDVAFSPVFFARRNLLVKPWVQDFIPSATDGDAPGDAFLDGVSISGRP